MTNPQSLIPNPLPIPCDPLVIAGREFTSRLIVGTGKYSSFAVMQRAHEASGADMVTVAVRRINISDRTKESLLDYIDTDKIALLPNTAGCYSADDAVRTARLGREAGLSNWVKLEVIGDERTLFPDNEELIVATKILVKEGFVVLPYTTDDPIVCRKLEDAGAAAVMPLGAPIGSGLGIQNANNIRIIREFSRVPDHPRRGCGNRVRRHHRHGAGRGRRADEHRHRRSAGSHGHGHRHEARRPVRPSRLPRRQNGTPHVREREQPAGGRREVKIRWSKARFLLIFWPSVRQGPANALARDVSHTAAKISSTGSMTGIRKRSCGRKISPASTCDAASSRSTTGTRRFRTSQTRPAMPNGSTARYEPIDVAAYSGECCRYDGPTGIH